MGRMSLNDKATSANGNNFQGPFFYTVVYFLVCLRNRRLRSERAINQTVVDKVLSRANLLKFP